MIQSCMGGGWCSKRGHCPHYAAASEDQRPEERLCPPGRDGWRLIVVIRPPPPARRTGNFFLTGRGAMA